jgi:hypothetical protein
MILCSWIFFSLVYLKILFEPERRLSLSLSLSHTHTHTRREGRRDGRGALLHNMAGLAETNIEGDTESRGKDAALETISNGDVPSSSGDDAPHPKRRNISRSCLHEVALPPGLV